MSDIVFVGACFPEQSLNELIEKNDITDIAANVFGQKLCRCLSKVFSSVFVINEHKKTRFPYSSKICVKSRVDEFENIYYYSYSYINIVYFDRFSKAERIKKLILKTKPRIVFVYSMHTPYLKPVIELKASLKYKVILIVPDLPEYMSNRRSRIAVFLKNRDIKKVYDLAKQVDGYIVLTKYMLEKLITNNKKTLILEGIADDFKFEELDESEREDYILYSGSVSKAYGLPEFIRYYIESDIKEKLYICGSGTYVEELKDIVLKNPQIKYLGVMKRNDLKDLQRRACLLVNPRSNADEYTKYSFPSKTMEYLSSGTPVMMEHLKGIPEEYYDYITVVENGDWVKALKSFSRCDKSVLNKRAVSAARFIQNKKTIKIQAKRLQSYIEEL